MNPVPAEAAKNIKGVAAKNKAFQVRGFLGATVNAEIKKGAVRPDLGLIFSRVPAAVAGVFTRNLVKAAPLLLDQERIKEGRGQALLVNSGNANACTGKAGLKDARMLAGKVAEMLAIPADSVFLASTGVIGQRLPAARMARAIPELVKALSPLKLSGLSEAIMTTDTFPKLLSGEIRFGKNKAALVAMAKGAGMIHPNMATMLSFVLTDLAVSPALLQTFLHKAVDRSFNRISVDGDTSTNDLVLVMANGLAGNRTIENSGDPGAREFSRTLDRLLLELAKMIIQDGEGATKFITLEITGARTKGEADLLAKTVATSPLVKTAFFGMDANWGRILAALGRSGVFFDPDQVDLYFNRVQVVRKGLSAGLEKERQAGKILKNRSLTVRIDLHQGQAKTLLYTCDLSLDYVRINAHYRT